MKLNKNNQKDIDTDFCYTDEIGADLIKKSKKKEGEVLPVSSVVDAEKTESYYQLNTKAVDKLVNAKEYVERGEIDGDIKKYKKGNSIPLPTWLKAVFIKFWFGGAVCFFFIWGLAFVIPNLFDIVIVTGIALGLTIDLLINNVFRFIASEHEYDGWMLLPMKNFWTMFVHLVYGIGIMLLIMTIYDNINILLIKWQNLPEESVPLGVEPLFFGLTFAVCDLAFVGIKNLIVIIVKKIKHKNTINS